MKFLNQFSSFYWFTNGNVRLFLYKFQWRQRFTVTSARWQHFGSIGVRLWVCGNHSVWLYFGEWRRAVAVFVTIETFLWEKRKPNLCVRLSISVKTIYIDRFFKHYFSFFSFSRLSQYILFNCCNEY